MPRWVELMPSVIRVNPRVLTSLTLLVLRQINPLHYIFFKKRGVNERLCIEEVGVDLEHCVHAHGPDVELIMDAVRKNNYFLGQVHLVSMN